MNIFNTLLKRINPNYVNLADGQQLDASARLRTSLPKILDIAKFEYWNNDHDWPETLTSGGTVTHLPNESANLLQVTSTIGSRVVKQSKKYALYQPGNSQAPTLTGIFGPHEAGIRKRFGYFDDKDGYYIEQSGGKYWLVSRTFVSGSVDDDTYRVEQKDWNVNTFMSTSNRYNNPSAKSFDLSKMVVFPGDFLWLGGDRIRPALKIDGVVYTAHEFVHAGLIDTPYWSSPSKCLRYEIENVSSGVGGSMKQVCSTVKSEGGEDIFGTAHVPRRSFYNAVAVPDTSATGGAYTPILAFRPKALFHGKDYRGLIRPISYEIFVEGNFPIEWILVHDAALTGASWQDVDAGNILSACEYDISATAMDISNAHIHNSGWASSANKGSATLNADPTGRIDMYNGPDTSVRADADTYTLGARAKGGTPEVSAAVREVEIY